MNIDKKIFRGEIVMKNEKESFRRNAITAAKDLFYGNKVIQDLLDAETIEEIQKIMVNARHKK